MKFVTVKIKGLLLRLILRLSKKGRIDYIGSGETLPPPLKTEEERAVIEMLPGDEVGS